MAGCTIAFRKSIRRCQAGSFTIMATAHLRMSASSQALLVNWGKYGAWSQPISIMMDTWISLSPMTPSGIFFLRIAGMGLDSADYDQDGFMDLFVANLDREMYSLYRNNRDATFDDEAGATGIAT